jgi:hypothetical protein
MLYGSEQPRIFTPPLRPLTPATSLGFSVIEFAEDVIHLDLLPWQKWLLVHMLETLPDGSLRYRTVVLLMARQNGKSTISMVLALWFMYVWGAPLVIGTAQDLDMAEEIWQGAVDLAQETPELERLIRHVFRVNGKKQMVLRSGERYKVRAANRRAGRGLSGDLVLLDELREHQSWDAWGAVSKTTMAREDALVFALSNAGDASSVVLRYLRKLCHASLGDPDGVNAADALDPQAEAIEPDEDLDVDEGSLGVFEWSAPPDTPIRDRAGWAAANPALGHTISERTIASAARTDPEWVFRTEVLCQWSEGTLEGPFPPGAWEASADPDSVRAVDSAIALGVDVSWDRGHSVIGLAAFREDGMAHVEVIASRAGTDWVTEWLRSPERSEAVRSAPVALQARGAPVSSLLPELQDARIPVVEWAGTALGVATGEFYDRVRAAIGEGTGAAQLRHRSQPLLNVAAATASTRPIQDAWLWDRRRSPTDVSPLIAVTGALWALLHAQPRTSVYETRRLEVL